MTSTFNLTQESLRNVIKLSNWLYEIPTPTRLKKDQLVSLLSERLTLSGNALKNKVVFLFGLRDLSNKRLPAKSIDAYLDDHENKAYKVKETFLKDRQPDAAATAAIEALPIATLVEIALLYNDALVIKGHIEKMGKEEMGPLVFDNFEGIPFPKRGSEFVSEDKKLGLQKTNTGFTYSLEGKKKAQVRKEAKAPSATPATPAYEIQIDPLTGAMSRVKKGAKPPPTPVTPPAAPEPVVRQGLPLEVPLPIAAAARAIEKAEPPPPLEINRTPAPPPINEMRQQLRQIQIDRVIEEAKEVPRSNAAAAAAEDEDEEDESLVWTYPITPDPENPKLTPNLKRIVLKTRKYWLDMENQALYGRESLKYAGRMVQVGREFVIDDAIRPPSKEEMGFKAAAPAATTTSSSTTTTSSLQRPFTVAVTEEDEPPPETESPAVFDRPPRTDPRRIQTKIKSTTKPVPEVQDVLPPFLKKSFTPEDDIDVFIPYEKMSMARGQPVIDLFINKRGDVVDESFGWYGRFGRDPDSDVMTTYSVQPIDPPDDLEVIDRRAPSVLAAAAAATSRFKRTALDPQNRLSLYTPKGKLNLENLGNVYANFNSLEKTAKYFNVSQSYMNLLLNDFEKEYGFSRSRLPFLPV